MSESLGEMVVAITGNTDDFNLSIDQAGKKFDSLTTIISQSTSDMARSFKNIDNEAKLWGESTDLIKQKQQALKNEMTSLMQQGFDPLSPKVQSLKTQYSALENEAKALGKEHVTLKGSMQEIDGMMGGFGSKIAKLLTNPYVLAAAAIIGTIKAFTDFTKELVEYGANIKETSEKTGVSTKALQEWKYVAEQTGGSLETITASIKMMTRGLDTNAETYKKLGIQIKDSNGEFRSSTDIFDDTVKALGDLTNDTERTKLALKLFGRGALDMVPLLKEGSAGIEELKQKANDLGLVLSDKAISGAHNLEKATDSLKASWKSFTMQLVQDSIPALTTIVNRLNEVATVSHLIGVVEENNKIIASYIYLRDNVIKYHDALESNLEIAKRDVASTYTTQSVKEAAVKKIIELTKSLQYVESEYSRQKKIDDDAQAKAAAKAATGNAAIKKLQDEVDKTQALKDERKKATDTYTTALKTINLEVSEGIKTEKEASDEKKKASEALLKALNDIIVKYGLVDGATVNLANSTAKSLGSIRKVIKTNTELLGEYSDESKKITNGIIKQNEDEAAKLYNLNLKDFTDRKKLLGDYSDESKKITNDIIKQNEDAALKTETAWKNSYLTIMNTLSPVFEAIGEALVKQGDAWGGVAKAAVMALANIVKGIGDQLTAMAAAKLVEAIADTFDPFTAWAAPGQYSASAGLTAGAGAAYIAQGALTAWAGSLGEGGIVMPSPGGSIAQIAEAGQPEAVFPLDKLNQFINTGTTTGSDSTTPINMIIQLDSKVLYSGIFQATKNKTVLISATSVV